MYTIQRVRKTIKSATFAAALFTALGYTPTASAQFGIVDDLRDGEPRVTRVHGATGCHAQRHTDMVERHAHGLKILYESHDTESPDKVVWVRCSVPHAWSPVEPAARLRHP